MASHLEKHWMKYAALLATVFSVLAFACTAPPMSYEQLGSKAYQHATLCTNSDPGAELASDAAERWNAATGGKVDIKVRIIQGVDLDAEDPEGCDAKLYFHAMRPNKWGPVLGNTEAGVVALDPSVISHPDRSDIVTHEVGHLLLGEAYEDTGHGMAHSDDPASIMFWMSCKGAQEITSDDVGRLP
jgi:hypothetical protein